MPRCLAAWPRFRLAAVVPRAARDDRVPMRHLSPRPHSQQALSVRCRNTLAFRRCSSDASNFGHVLECKHAYLVTAFQLGPAACRVGFASAQSNQAGQHEQQSQKAARYCLPHACRNTMPRTLHSSRRRFIISSLVHSNARCTMRSRHATTSLP
jgi:hypothetical protein